MNPAFIVACDSKSRIKSDFCNASCAAAVLAMDNYQHAVCKELRGCLVKVITSLMVVFGEMDLAEDIALE